MSFVEKISVICTFDYRFIWAYIEKKAREVLLMDASKDLYLDLVKRIEGIFHEMDSDILVDLGKNNEEYIAVRESLDEMKERYPLSKPFLRVRTRSPSPPRSTKSSQDISACTWMLTRWNGSRFTFAGIRIVLLISNGST